jgi:hypothetical protein
MKRGPICKERFPLGFYGCWSKPDTCGMISVSSYFTTPSQAFPVDFRGVFSVSLVILSFAFLFKVGG